MAKGSSALTPVVTVDRGSSQPLHSQIYRSLRNAIATGILRPGQRVPSSRAMGTELNVSRITILEAYGQLLAEGYFKSSRGAGTFVSSSLPEYRNAALEMVEILAQLRPQNFQSISF